MGEIQIELLVDNAPVACRNFAGLCLTNYYDNTVAHHLDRGGSIKFGDPTGEGYGGISFDGVPFETEIGSRKFDRPGLVGMTDGGENNASQFFITLGACPALTRTRSLFGAVTAGSMDVLREIAEADIDEAGRPTPDIVIMGAGVGPHEFDLDLDDDEDMTEEPRADDEETEVALPPVVPAEVPVDDEYCVDMRLLQKSITKRRKRKKTARPTPEAGRPTEAPGAGQVASAPPAPAPVTAPKVGIRSAALRDRMAALRAARKK